MFDFDDSLFNGVYSDFYYDMYGWPTPPRRGKYRKEKDKNTTTYSVAYVLNPKTNRWVQQDGPTGLFLRGLGPDPSAKTRPKSRPRRVQSTKTAKKTKEKSASTKKSRPTTSKSKPKSATTSTRKTNSRTQAAKQTPKTPRASSTTTPTAVPAKFYDPNKTGYRCVKPYNLHDYTKKDRVESCTKTEVPGGTFASWGLCTEGCNL